MSVHRRSLRSIAIIGLAVPVIVAVYFATFVRRVLDAPRLLLASVLGAAVIGSVYADEAYRRAPVGVRRGLDVLSNQRVSPLRAAMVVALAVALLGVSAPTAPVTAADPAEAVVKAARSYLGTPYRLGGTGTKRFDCSGLIYRIFKDAGELPRIGGKRLRAVGYLRWFKSRGLVSKRDGARGDLVVWGDGAHIGIYLGKGRVISALTTGVAVHGLHEINMKFTTFLKVSWIVGDGEETGRKGKNRDRKNRSDDNAPTETAEAPAAGEVKEAVETGRGLAIGTMNLRRNHDPDARILGWVSRGSKFTITGTGQSPSGALWYSIEMRNGKSGWVWSRWVQVLDN
jgi:cell wall-associated NlpC family hydrolase